ncbi:hypothetical protein BDW22DRAFT_1343039 [Trametopsis cervina]|nr:hypothetical protein BDW22DRAFT_1343039 [Trametopsis cervina]
MDPADLPSHCPHRNIQPPIKLRDPANTAILETEAHHQAISSHRNRNKPSDPPLITMSTPCASAAIELSDDDCNEVPTTAPKRKNPRVTKTYRALLKMPTNEDGLLCDINVQPIQPLVPSIVDGSRDIEEFFSEIIMQSGRKGVPKPHRRCKTCLYEEKNRSSNVWDIGVLRHVTDFVHNAWEFDGNTLL